MARKRIQLVWLILWILALCHFAQPQEESPPPPRPAIDDCECEAWDRISKNITSEFVHCRRDPSCAGTSCAGKAPGILGPYNFSSHVLACRQPIALRVHLAFPSKGINWTRDFERSERVKVPGLQFFANELRISWFIQINITKEAAQDDVILGVSIWPKTSIPKVNSSSFVQSNWTEAMDLIEHQHLPLPACKDGKPVPEPCDNSTSPSLVTTTVRPSPVGRKCDPHSFLTGCDDTEMCSEVSSNLSVCVCLSQFHRDEKGVCVSGGGGGGGGGGVTTTPSAKTTVSPPDPSASHGAAIGGTFGALIIIALAAAVFWWWRKRRQTRLRIVRLYDDEEVLMRNDGYQPVANQDDDNQII